MQPGSGITAVTWSPGDSNTIENLWIDVDGAHFTDGNGNRIIIGSYGDKGNSTIPVVWTPGDNI